MEREMIEVVRDRFSLADKNKYFIQKTIVIPQLSIVSFELKIDNWKRALFQAIRYKTFSDYSYIVMPIEKRNILEKNIEIFIANNVGIALYDEKLNIMRIMYRAKKNQRKSKIHSNYMSGKILFESKLEKHMSSSVKIR